MELLDTISCAGCDSGQTVWITDDLWECLDCGYEWRADR